MYFIYTAVLYLLLPFVLLKLIWLGRLLPAYRQRWPERFGRVARADFTVRPIWIHAVSVGEVQVSRPLVNWLREHFPDVPILITTVTPTGAAAVRQHYADAVMHSYMPYDLPFAVGRFLRVVRPRLLIVLETEIWPNLYRQCAGAGVPLVLLNARLSERSRRGYRLFRPLAKATLAHVSAIAVQSDQDAERLIDIGAPADRIRVSGNLKFDISLPPSIQEQAEVIRRRFSVNRPVWIAASTHAGEEALVLDALDIVLREVPDSLLILAPRHPQRCDAVAELCARRGYRIARHSEPAAYTTATQILLLDVLGQLTVYYAASDIAFVGGSLVPIGGHNMLEPACLGLPIVSGRHLFNFQEVAALLTQGDALLQVDDAAGLGRKVVELFGDGNLRYKMGQQARRVVQDNQGSINRVVGILQRYL